MLTSKELRAEAKRLRDDIHRMTTLALTLELAADQVDELGEALPPDPGDPGLRDGETEIRVPPPVNPDWLKGAAGTPPRRGAQGRKKRRTAEEIREHEDWIVNHLASFKDEIRVPMLYKAMVQRLHISKPQAHRTLLRMRDRGDRRIVVRTDHEYRTIYDGNGNAREMKGQINYVKVSAEYRMENLGPPKNPRQWAAAHAT